MTLGEEVNRQEDSDELASIGWRLLRRLGKGGQAPVYEVERLDAPGVTFAMKYLGRRRDKPLARFQNELQTLRQLAHPGIVRFLGCANEEDELQYYWINLIEGAKSLSDLIKTKPSQNPFQMAPLKALGAFIEIAEALNACDKKYIVHRDLNPGNILITPDERIVLIDFGLAQFPGSDTMPSVDEAVGAAAYRPPECRAHSFTPVDIRSDLYSVGKLLWSMVVNELAFEGESRVFSDLALARKLPDCQAAWHLFHIFEKTIRHDRDDRFSKPADAIRVAKKTRDLILANAPPLEVLYGGKCKTCRLGTLAPADGELPYTKVAVYRPGSPGISQLAWNCPVCGQFELTRREVLEQTIQQRATLK